MWRSSMLGVLVLLASSCTTNKATCSTEPGPEMRPGWNCLSCHREGGPAEAKLWTAGGTVYESLDDDPCQGTPDVDVVFFDNLGHELTRVKTNNVGNFHLDTPLPEGFRVGVERDGKRAMMPFPPPAGSCNACHATSPIAGAKGLIRAPD